MSFNYSPSSWTLKCAYCEWYIVVNNRGMSKGDMGAGVEAANLMEYHVNKDHDKTWSEYLEDSKE